MQYKIYDTSKVVKGTILYDIRIYVDGELLNTYYNLTATEYSTVIGAFKILEKRKYKEVEA